MKKIFEISLGVVTSVGGFLEAGSLATATQAGAGYRFQLLWAVVLGTLCLVVLVEMSGRFTIASHHTIADGIRERFGISLFLFPLVATLLVSFLTLSAEIGGISLALQYASGISFQWWALPVGFAVWLLLWKGTFGVIEKGVALLGLVTLSFLVAAVKLHPPWTDVAAGALPSLPDHDPGHYWFTAVSILGASISPYLFLFYSSGALEDKWDKSYLIPNRIIAWLGMGFGGFIAGSAMIVAGMVFPPQGVGRIDSYDQLTTMLTPVFGFWGFVLFVCSLGIACLGAALEIALEQAYLVAQGFGWHWGENVPPKEAPGFSLAYSGFVLLAALLMVTGLDPLSLTNFSMALTAASLPLGVVPFLFLMNDAKYMGEHRNGWTSNVIVMLVIALAFVLAVVTIPLQILGG